MADNTLRTRLAITQHHRACKGQKPKKKTGNCEENRSSVECGVILAIFIFGSCTNILFKNYPYYIASKR